GLYVGVGERTGILRHFVDPTTFYVLSMVTVTIVGVILVGRTSFWGPLVNWRANKITRQEAVNKIAGRYREFVETFEVARACRVKRIAGSVSGMSAGKHRSIKNLPRLLKGIMSSTWFHSDRYSAQSACDIVRSSARTGSSRYFEILGIVPIHGRASSCC